jgi:lysophospholipase L1-like esterase
LVTACGRGGAALDAKTTTTTRTHRASSTTSLTSVLDVPRYAAVGDSLMWMARDELPVFMSPEPVDIHAVPGRTANDMQYALASVDLAHTDALVISVGTNDALHGATSKEVAEIDAVAEMVAEVPCVRWMALMETSPNQTYNEAARRINAELFSLAARYADTLAIARWDLELAAHPEWLSEDGTHHTPAGSKAYAELMSNALRGCPTPT